MKFPSILFFAILLIFFPKFSLASEYADAIEAYISTYDSIAISEMKRTGIPASIKLAQAINESGFGKSYLARNGNNHFGIKCGKDWTGATISKKDDRYVRGKLKNSCFRKYESASESFKAHSDFLVNRSRYASLFNLSPADYKGWARGLQKAGYATSKTYARKLIDLIERYDLHKIDIVEEKIDAPEIIGGKKSKKRTQIVNYAKKLKGKRYRYGGRSKSGFDCSGFTLYVFKKHGIELNASSKTQAKQGKKIKVKDAKPGDLLFFSHDGKSIGHVGMVFKNQRDGIWMIHASSKRGVVVDNISKSKYWKSRLKMARSILP